MPLQVGSFLTASPGIDVKVETVAKLASDAPSTYPNGVSTVSAITRRNMAQNPGGSNAAYWSSLGSAGTTEALDAAFGHEGSDSIKYTLTSTGSAGGKVATDAATDPIAAGDTIRWSMWVYCSRAVTWQTYWERIGGSYTGGIGGSGVAVAANTWTKLEGSKTFDSTNATVSGNAHHFGAYVSSGLLSGDFFWVDEILVEENVTALGAWFDGDTSGASWTGTSGASASTWVNGWPAAGVVLTLSQETSRAYTVQFFASQNSPSIMYKRHSTNGTTWSAWSTVVFTDEIQTLTNKSISGASNTLSAIPSSAVTGLDTHTAATAAHGATGAVVGTTNVQTLSNKTFSNLTAFTAGIDTKLPNGKLASDLPATYPIGVSTLSVLGTNGWPHDGTVLTICQEGDRAYSSQLLMGNSASKTYKRASSNGTSWSAWFQVVFPDEVQTLTNKSISGASNTITALPTTALADGAVTAAKLLDLNVTTAKLANSAVTTSTILDLNITTAKIADAAVGTTKIADGSVTAAKLMDLNVTTAKVANAAVTVDKLADPSVSTSKLYDLNVTTVKIADGAVTAVKIATDTITASQIAAGAVGSSELAAGAVTAGKIGAGAIATADIANLAVTTAKLAASAVTTNEIANLAVTAAKIASGTITTTQIATDTIVAGNIAASAVGSSELAAGAVIAGKIGAGAIATADIANLAITGAKIATDTITATQIAANTITAAQIVNNTITGTQISTSAAIPQSAITNLTSDFTARPKGVVAFWDIVINENTINITAEKLILSFSFTAEASRSYRIYFSGGLVDSESTVAQSAYLIFRWTQAAGAVDTASQACGRQIIATPASSNGDLASGGHVLGAFTTTAGAATQTSPAAGTVKMGLFMKCSNGTNPVKFWTTSINPKLLVEDMGSAATIESLNIVTT